jgi:SHS2 domain-containing protein
VEHTADVGIEAEGVDAGACLADAATAVTSVLCGDPHPEKLGSEHLVPLKIEAPDLQSLAVAVLAEVIWLKESRDLLITSSKLHVEPAGEVWRARGDASAVRYDPARHGRGVEVKAVTYHQVMFERDHAGTWRLRVFLDL